MPKHKIKKRPKPGHVREINTSVPETPCPVCGVVCKRHSVGHRYLHEIGLNVTTVLSVTLSKHYCVKCRKHFSRQLEHIAPIHSRYTTRVVRAALNLIQLGNTLDQTSRVMWDRYHVRVPATTIHDWMTGKYDEVPA